MIEETILRAKELAYWMEELKAYKATGLLPEEIVALQASNEALKKETVPLVRAKIEGRLVTLPCKLTDTVYVLETAYKGKKAVGERVVSAKIDHITIGEAGKPVYDLCSETENWYYSMEPGDFYLTREEAEAAKKKKNCEMILASMKDRTQETEAERRELAEMAEIERMELTLQKVAEPETAARLIEIIRQQPKEKQAAFLETTAKAIMGGADYSACKSLDDMADAWAKNEIERLWGE